jgi:hypothetical protein
MVNGRTAWPFTSLRARGVADVRAKLGRQVRGRANLSERLIAAPHPARALPAFATLSPQAGRGKAAERC